jgi:hypothetical protein
LLLLDSLLGLLRSRHVEVVTLGDKRPRIISVEGNAQTLAEWNCSWMKDTKRRCLMNAQRVVNEKVVGLMGMESEGRCTWRNQGRRRGKAGISEILGFGRGEGGVFE